MVFKKSLTLVASVVIIVLLAGCGNGNGGGGKTAVADPYHAAKAGETPPDVVVVVEETNRPKFDLYPAEVNGQDVSSQFDQDNTNNMEEPLTIPPGRVRFFLKNTGTLAHDFEVRSLDGTTLKHMKKIGAGRTGEFELNLEPGEYVIACPVSDHDGRGMQRLLVVDSEAQYPKLSLKSSG